MTASRHLTPWSATLPPSRSKRLLRRAIHLLSYHFILKRRRTTVARVAGFRLTVRPTVFHPRYFLTSKFFANFLSDINLTGKRVADVGTGSGILALASGGCMYVLFSTESDLDLLGNLISRAGFAARLVAERSILIESMIIYS